MQRQANKQNLTIRYAFIPGFYWMSFAVIMGFSSLYLLSQGLTNTQIGIMTAVACTFSAFFQPILASYADRTTRMSLKEIVVILAGIVVLLAASLLICHDKWKTGTALFYSLAIFSLQMLTPLVNSLGTESINRGKKINYGACRAIGSLGYSVIAFILGKVTVSGGPISVPVAMLLVYAALLLSLLAFPFEKRTEKTEKITAVSGNGFFGFVHKYPRYCIVLVGCILIFISHIFLNNFTLQIIMSKGGGNAEMGFAQGLGSLIELPIMFLFGWMLTKLSCDIWFRMTGIFFFLKSLFSWIAPNIPLYYAVQLFQIFGWALITVSSVFYVNAIMDETDAIKGQAYYTVTFTVANVIGSVIGGVVLDQIGVSGMLCIGTVCAFVGMMIMLFFGKIKTN